MRLPFTRAALLGALLVTALSLSLSSDSRTPSASAAAGFVTDTIVTGLNQPTDFAFAPDGRIFIAQKGGVVRIFENGQLLGTPFITLAVNTADERGLVGLALDPDFATNHYVYLYLVPEPDPSTPSGPKTSKLMRVTANGNVAQPGSEYTVLGTVQGTAADPSCNDFPAGSDCIPAQLTVHTGGGLRFAPDGKLFLSIGESGVREQAQDPDSLSGKLVRLNPDGTAPTDNPGYTGDPNAVRSKIWANGLRNPFRIGIQPGTSLPFIADVGGIYIEEINKGVAGANYGWPCYEAELNLNFGPVCDPLYQSGTQTLPIYQYPHPPGAAVIGGAFYQGVNYPPEYQNAFFFGDYVRNFVKTINVDANNNMVPGSLRTVLASAPLPVSFQSGPEGNVYFASLNGSIYRIRYATDNRPPVAIADATPTNGPIPLSVQFTGVDSYDPDLDPITYLWDFGDGTTSTAPNPTHLYADDGIFQVTLTVKDSSNVTAVDAVSISAGNLHPVATIATPPDGIIYQPGQVISFSGSADDPEDGPIPESGLAWDIRLHHCEVQGGSCHDHPFWQDPGSNGSFVSADDNHATFGVDFVFHEIKLIATDSALRTGTASIFISPDSDGDGLSDHIEFFAFDLDPFDTDSDNDGAPDGDEDFDGDQCGNLAEMQTASGSEQQGGLRDPLNPWDYFNPGKDGVNRINDITLVIQHYGHDQGVAPDYAPNFDRTTLAGGHPWQFDPPNGTIRIVDVSGAVDSYGHDCAT